MHDDSAQGRPGRPEGGPAGRPPVVGPIAARMRSVLSLAAAARVGMSRRMRISLHDLEAIEHVMTSAGEDGGPLTVGPSELARRLGVSTAATTQSLHRLEASGHVRRRPHPDDRRRQVVEVTPEGAQRVFATLAPLLQMLQAQAAGLSASEQRAVLKFLEGQETAYRQFLAHLAASAAAPVPDGPGGG